MLQHFEIDSPGKQSKSIQGVPLDDVTMLSSSSPGCFGPRRASQGLAKTFWMWPPLQMFLGIPRGVDAQSRSNWSM